MPLRSTSAASAIPTSLFATFDATSPLGNMNGRSMTVSSGSNPPMNAVGEIVPSIVPTWSPSIICRLSPSWADGYTCTLMRPFVLFSRLSP